MLALGLFSLLSHALSQPFSPSEVSQMRGYFESNINVGGCYQGFVVAAPTHSGPDYYYHWQRDAAISMFALQQTATSAADFDPKMETYVKWCQHSYSLSDPNGIDVRGEPKFNCDGSVYSKGWCRPQDDGPALTAKALVAYANYKLTQPDGKTYVQQNLYKTSSGPSPPATCSVPNDQKKDCGHVGTNQQQCEAAGCCWQPEGQHSQIPWCYHKSGSGGGGGLIPNALDYVASQWQSSNNCDLWEEIRGKHFFTLMVQRKGLLAGATLAKSLGDSTRATNYANAAMSMVNDIKSFQHGNIIQDDQRQQDCSVAVASLYGGTGDLFGPTDTTIVNTINSFRSYYKTNFPINSKDDQAGIPGTLIGRYANDQYQGCSGGGSTGDNKGHSWILCTNAYADVYYHNSMAVQEHIREKTVRKFLDVKRLEIYADTMEHDQPKLSAEMRKHAQSWNTTNVTLLYEVAQKVANGLATEGDGMLQRVRHHIQGCSFHMSEQICETNGNLAGAKDLTWSYGTVLQAMYTRGKAVELGVEPREFEKKRLIKNPFMPAEVCYGCQNQC